MPETTANLPEHKGTYGPVENADDTRQAQQQVANDAPVDINMNAFCTRSQALTFDLVGKEFSAAAARRTALFDQLAHDRSAKTPV